MAAGQQLKLNSQLEECLRGPLLLRGLSKSGRPPLESKLGSVVDYPRRTGLLGDINSGEHVNVLGPADLQEAKGLSRDWNPT